MTNEQGENIGRAVLRVSHDVDHAGHVVQVQLEPLLDAPQIHVIEAAWQAACRCHPWIVGDAAATNAEAVRKVALSQVNHLMNAANEVLMLTKGIEHEAVHRLRDAIVDLRGYMPALRGEVQQPNHQDSVFKFRRTA